VTAARGLRVGVLGLGRAGGSLAASLLLSRKHQLVAVASRSKERRAHFVEVHPDGPKPVARAATLLARLQELSADLLILAVPDDALQTVARAVARAGAQSEWLPNVVAHMSGANGPEALWALEGRAHLATFHPLAALDGKSPIPTGTLLAVSARQARTNQRLVDFARDLRLEPAHVRAGQHARYHLGAVVAANLAIALLDEGVLHLSVAGVPPALARKGLARLLRSTADAAEHGSLAKALTGPVARGDAGTVARHLEVLKEEGGEPEALYRALTRRLLDVADLDERAREKLEELLE
jgi:predicted short-subunit dehydrogenase-like oxidoreductase (DUF2520 family)